METLLAALQSSGFAQTMRSSVFLYPLANVLHVLGALSFFAAVAAMDVKVLRCPDRDQVRRFIDRVRPVAVAGFLLQIATGLMLLAPEATHIGHNPAFQLKLTAIALALLNVILLESILHVRKGEHPPEIARFSAAASLALWLSTAAAGRLIAYF